VSGFSNSVTAPYVFVTADEKFGDEPELVFDVAAEDNGKIVTLTATTIPWDDPADEFSSDQDIEVSVPDEVTIEISCVVSGDEAWTSEPPNGYFFIGQLCLSRFIQGPAWWLPPTEYYSYAVCSFSNSGDAEYPDPLWTNPTVPAFLYTNPNVDEIEPSSVDGLLGMAVEEAEDDTYYVLIKQQHIRIDGFDSDVTIKTYKGGLLVGDETFSRTNDTDSYTYTTKFATIDGETGEITLLDPPVTTFV